MKCLTVKPSLISGKICIPASKSHTMRALLMGAMAKGKSTITNYLQSPDTLAMVKALRAFGISIVMERDLIEITGSQLTPCDDVIDAGNSGIVLRFIGAISALLPTYTVITGDHSIRQNRPVQPLLNALTQLNAVADSSRLDGKAPIIIKGPIKPGRAIFSGEDSQPVSALLIAASFLEGTTILEVTNPGEKPWIDVTLFWLRKFGGKIVNNCYSHYTITGPISYQGFDMEIPGDFSSCAFPLVAALITKSTLRLDNVDVSDVQGDKKILEILQQMGAKIEIEEKSVTIQGNVSLKGIVIDVNDLIDAIPILTVLACFATGKTEIINAGIARKKESDRLHAITLELQKMGAIIEEKEDGLIVTPNPLNGTTVQSHSDHRIAMALAIAGMGASGETLVEGIECISKSFATFVSDFQTIGANFYE